MKATFLALFISSLLLATAVAVTSAEPATGQTAVPAPGSLPARNPTEPERPLMWPNEFAVLSATGTEVIEAMMAQEPAEDAEIRQRNRNQLALRTPERQARALSGSA
jgi:hypothetical protein